MSIFPSLSFSSDMKVVGRATLDVRVCASPGRDKAVEEKKRGVASVGPDEGPPERRRGRKRGRRVLGSLSLSLSLSLSHI